MTTWCLPSCLMGQSASSGSELGGHLSGLISHVKVQYGAAWAQGRRPTMEDRHVIVEKFSATDPTAYFGLFDGHGGVLAADFCGKNLHRNLQADEDYMHGNVENGLKAAFLHTDETFLRIAERDTLSDGCTAMCLLVRKDRVYVANAGDCRCIVYRNGMVDQISTDHRPKDPEEEKRVNEAGGFVVVGRVMGQLAVSRAIGDCVYKRMQGDPPKRQRYVISDPDTFRFNRKQTDEFAVVACDGLWDVMSNAEVVDFVKSHHGREKDLGMVCKRLVEHAIRTKRTTDNVSVIILGL